MRLAARAVKRFGAFALDLALEVGSGETLALVGESGSGKSTTLRLIAGLARPDRGRIALGDEVWFDGDGGRDLPAWRRAVGWVPQDYALFPHLDVLGNVAFGLHAARRPGAEARRLALAALARLGVADLAARRPRELSGGQQQRVALARALVLEPRVLLLDEPLAALDLHSRRTVRGELRRLLASLPCATVYVTHDAVEAFVFGDRIAVLEDGAVRQSGPPEELLRRPRTPYVASLMGVNLYRGRLEPGGAPGVARLRLARGALTVVDPGDGDAEVFAVVDPREVTLSRAAPAGSAQNVLRGPVAEVTHQAAAALGLAEGVEVHAAFKATGVQVFR